MSRGSGTFGSDVVSQKVGKLTISYTDIRSNFFFLFILSQVYILV